MPEKMGMTWQEALQKLKNGNEMWLKEREGQTGNVSVQSVKNHMSGQAPYAVVVTCSDSRVIPEAVFHAGTGDIFVIRTAGNTIGEEAVGSIEYAIDHLGTRLVLVLGHTHCGAVGAAIDGASGHYVRCITDRITKAIGSEKDPYKACCLNVLSSAEEVKKKLADRKEPCVGETEVRGAIFSLEDGTVKFL